MRRLPRAVAAGHSCLVFDGEAGIGKTTIWDEAVARIRTICQVLVARPVEAEMQIGYSALTDLVEPVFDEVVPGCPNPNVVRSRLPW